MVERRREAGAWLRHLREERGLTQRQLAERVGIEFYTFVSQIEAGRGRIPADRYQKWADALEVKPKIFVKNMLQFYEPSTYSILFGAPDQAESNDDLVVEALKLPTNIFTLQT